MNQIWGILQGIYYSFPIQLLILHIKRHQLLLGIWLLFFLTVTGRFGSSYGIPYLFWDPEYLGFVGYLSFAIVGAAFGGFLVTWNITSYLLNSFRFPFLASLRWPFAVFTLNNFILPLIFLVTYGSYMIRFQRQNEFATESNLIFQVTGFFAGVALILLLTTLYFSATNQNVEGYLKRQQRNKKISKVRRTILMKRDNRWEALRKERDVWRVDSYFTFRFHFRPTRGVEHYDEKVVKIVFRQHHINALVIQFGTLVVLVGTGAFLEKDWSIIPAAASCFLLFSAIIAVLGVFRFWMGGWSTSMFLILIFGIHFYSKYEHLGHENRPYGLIYNAEQIPYTLPTLDSLTSVENLEHDYHQGEIMLENWLAKQKRLYGENYIPRMVVVNATGGGLRTSMFAVGVLQVADTLTNGSFMEHTTFMSGASGGMLGIAYFRELFLRRSQGRGLDINSPQYMYKAGTDLLNGIMFMTTTTDFFHPWQEFNYNGESYLKDRAYLFEKQFNENTDFVMDKPISDYRQPELEGQIPMLVANGAITNDSRRLLFSAQPISYLMKPAALKPERDEYLIDAVDYAALLKDLNPEDTRFTSVLRINATYPYILPQVVMPTEPPIRIVDAGVVDNYGLNTSIRFLDVYSDWILENTAGVVFVEIRDREKFKDVKENRKSYFSKILNPIGAVYGNLTTMQDYNDEMELALLRERLGNNFEYVVFEYGSNEDEERASMSFHLTTKEKEDIVSALSDPHNAAQFQRIASLVK